MLRELLTMLGVMSILVGSIMCGNAFPLTGGNGIVNATVYGVTEKTGINGDSTIYYIDMSADSGGRDARRYYSVILVDSEDIAYGVGLEDGAMSNFNSNEIVNMADLELNNNTFRDTVQIGVPVGTIIKRLKIAPDNSDPFSIDWNGAPEVSSAGIKLQFYRGQSEYTRDGKYTWTFDLKVTNLGNDTITIPRFSMKDSSGWIYKGSNTRDKLVGGEALRFLVTFPDVGASSRPSELMYDLTPPVTFESFRNDGAESTKIYGSTAMDIEAWV